MYFMLSVENHAVDPKRFWTLKPHLNVHGCLCIIYSRKISKQVTSQARFQDFFPPQIKC